jgi:tetratricopeptide (TPR) repeat protein
MSAIIRATITPMPDPLINAGSHALDASSAADRDAKIEQLLLTGLDHYFAGHYEQAINVWTRALFLDRNHPRARAYIDRARSAVAERQRESDELLHSGVAAFERGDGGEARRLLAAAIAGGAPSDEAIVLLDRLNRLGVAIEADEPAEESRPPARPVAADPAGRPTALRVLRGTGAILLVAAAGVFAAAMWDRLQLRSLVAGGETTRAARTRPIAYDPALPLPRRAETAVARARALAAGGHLRDALSVLDQVRATDAEKPEADRLRTAIQHELLDPARARRVP